MERLRREDGVTLMELLIGASIGIILSLALYGFLDTTSKSSERTAARIDAAKLGRPVMASIVDRLHSTCVAADTVPIKAGSGPLRLDFVHETGSGVTLTPDLRRIRWVGTQGQAGKLMESVFPAVGGSAPNWTFATSASERTLLEPVKVPADNAIFKYYAYNASGALVAVPGTLTEETAASVVQVSVSFEVPSRLSTDSKDGGTTFTDTVPLRFTPPGLDAGTETLPCT